MARGVFLFSDIEDSTVLWEQYPEAMADAVAEHDRVISEAVTSAGGRVVKRVGDAMDAKFDDVGDAVDAAVAAQRELAERSWGELGTLRVRMAIGAGAVTAREEGFFGPVLNRMGRVLAAGHGGQVLVDAEAAGELSASDGPFGVRSLGEFRFKGLEGPQEVFQLVAEGLEERFPPLRVDQPAGGSPSGTVWGYELGERVGEGRLGVVHRGFQPSSGREVAVKVVRPELVNEPWFVRRFEAEARIVARLDHVHLVGLRDFWRDPDGAYVVMPWLGGGSLDGALDGRPWDLGRAARLVSQVGSALLYIHDRGLVHGGVGPSNVLLDAEGDAYLSDGWLATRLLNGGSDLEAVAVEDLRGLALLVVAVLSGAWPQDPGRLPAVAEMRPEVDGEIDAAIARAVATDGPVGEDAVRRFLDVVLPALEEGLEVAGPVRNPYKGLEAFGEADAADFFGRDELVRSLVDAVGEVPLVAVVGPSGSGKSSVVRAGLLPAIHRGDLGGEWLVTDMVPGARPFEALEAALLRVAVERPEDLQGTLRSGPDGLLSAARHVLAGERTRLLLVVDQFEELFSLVDDEDVRRLFLDALVALAEDPGERVRVVVTMRADFFDRPLDHAGFAELFKAGLVPVAPPSDEELRAAIVEPARSVGLELEAGLAAAIIADVQDQPGSLPLLQHALSELFLRRENDRLTLDAYRESGGVIGALARRAEAVHVDLDDRAQGAARQVFLRLVALGEGAEDTRRRVRRSELESLPGLEAEVGEVLDAFGAHRLLTFDRDTVTREPTVEVAHEALLRHWGRLRGWIDDARDDLRRHRRLRQAATQWREAGEDDAYLLSPARVEAVDDWLEEAEVTLAGDERRFLDAARRRKRELEAAEAERAAHEQELERRARRRLRVIAGVSTLAAIVAVGLSVFAFEQQSQAEQERAAAERSERTATARGLASASMAELGNDPERSILLGLEAVRTTRETDGDVLPEAESALRQALLESQVRQRLETPGGFASLSVAPDGRVASLSMEGVLEIWDPETWETIFDVEGLSHRDNVLYDDVSFSPDGSAVVVADDEHRGAIRDAETGDVRVELEGRLSRPEFSPDGRFVAGVRRGEDEAVVAQDPTVAVWDVETGEVVWSVDIQGQAFDIAFSPDSTLLATAGGGASHLLDVETGERHWSLRPPEANLWVVGFHPDGDLVAFGTGPGPVELRRVDDGELVETFTGHTSLPQAIAFDEDGRRLASGDQDGVTYVWDVEGRQELAVLPGHTGPLSDAAFLPGTDRVITASRDGTARIWHVGHEGGYEHAVLASMPPPLGIYPSFSPDGRHLASAAPDDSVRVWEVATMKEVLRLPHDDPVHVVSYSGDGSVLATASVVGFHHVPPDEWENRLDIWDASTGEHLGSPATFEEPAWDVSLNSDGSILLHAGDDFVVSAVEVGTGDERFTFEVDTVPGRVAFSPDDERVLVGGLTPFVLDAETGEVLHELDVGISDATFVADRRIVASERDGPVRELDIGSGEEIRTILREDAPVRSVDVRDDILAVSSGTAFTLRDLVTGQRRSGVEHDDTVSRLRVSADGRFLAASVGQTVQVHVVETEDLLDLAHDRLTRWWTEAECEEFLQRACPDPPEVGR